MKTTVHFKGLLLALANFFYLIPGAYSQQIEERLNGNTFNISVIEKFKDGRMNEWEEVLRFENNKVHSGFAASIRFQPAEYTEVLDSSGVISFTAESSISEEHIERDEDLRDTVRGGHVLKWHGTFNGEDLHGYAQKYERGELAREYWFHAIPAPKRPYEFNQWDSAGLKHGWWPMYLDANLAEIKNEEADTVYYWYTYYDHGYNVNRRGAIGLKGQSCIVPPGLQPDSTGYILLNGEFKSLYKNGQTNVAVNAVDGYLTWYAVYFESGVLDHYFDYTKLYNDRLHTIFFSGYEKSGELKYSGYFRKITSKKGRALWLLFME